MSEIVEKHNGILDQMNTGDFPANLGKELATLAPVAHLQEVLGSINEEEASLQELLQDATNAGDVEMEAECRGELEALETKRARVEKRVVQALLPRDEDDYGMDAVLEIRSGTGGDEAALFTGEILDVYQKTAKAHGFNTEVLNISKADLGGIKEASLSITGRSSFGGTLSPSSSFDIDNDEDNTVDSLDGLGPYGLLKYESGVHRVQRVPINDTKIQTSACSVAVLPSPRDDSDDIGKLLPLSELKIDTFRASGAGGQHVNTTDSAVRVTHLPTGTTASIQDERSQHKNKAKAMKLVAARVREQKREAEARERGDAKQSLMGGGDRSERIRTYNFPQDRVTDHRCKQSEHGITKMFSGSDTDGLVATFAPTLRAMTRDELIKELEDQ